jgi:hypothetical protein
VNAYERTASDALLDVARSWISVETPEEEVSPRELAMWLASWRSEVADTLAVMERSGGEGAFAALVDESLEIDGGCKPIEFVEWFIAWRERVMATLEAEGRGSEIAGIPLHAALSLIVFQFEDDLSDEALAAARGAMVEIEREGFSSAGCANAATVIEGLLRTVASMRARADVITRVHRELIVDTARERLGEYRRLIGSR